MLRNIRITHRFAVLAVLGLCLSIGSIALVISQIRTSMLEQKRADIRHSVEIAATIAEAYLNRVKSGELTDADARTRERALRAY